MAERPPPSTRPPPADRRDEASVVRLEIDATTLARLLARGMLCVADFQCLDSASKQTVWRLCRDNAGADLGRAPAGAPGAQRRRRGLL